MNNSLQTAQEKKDSPAVKALQTLGTYKTELDLKLSEFEEKKKAMLSRPAIAANKENALKGVSLIKDYLADFKTKRIEQTSIFTSIVKIFTDGENKLLSFQNELQEFANKCMSDEKDLLAKQQAEITAQKNRDAELVTFKIKCKEKILLDLNEAKSKTLKAILSINDSDTNKSDLETFKKELAQIPLTIKLLKPEFTFVHNTTVDKTISDKYWNDVIEECMTDINSVKVYMSQIVNDALNQAPDLFKMFTENAEAAKRQIEANHVLQQSKIEVEVAEVHTQTAIAEQVNTLNTIVPEIVVDSKTTINLKVDTHQGLLNLITWWLSSDNFFKLSIDDLEGITVSKMLTAAKKQYKDNPAFKLEGITKTTTEKAK